MEAPEPDDDSGWAFNLFTPVASFLLLTLEADTEDLLPFSFLSCFSFILGAELSEVEVDELEPSLTVDDEEWDRLVDEVWEDVPCELLERCLPFSLFPLEDFVLNLLLLCLCESLDLLSKLSLCSFPFPLDLLTEGWSCRWLLSPFVCVLSDLCWCRGNKDFISSFRSLPPEDVKGLLLWCGVMLRLLLFRCVLELVIVSFSYVPRSRRVGNDEEGRIEEF